MAWLAEPEFATNNRARGLVIRRNSDDLKDWVSRARSFYYGIAEIVGNPPEIRFKDGATCVTGHLKDESAYTKYQGHEYQKILIEELTQIPTEELYLKLISSARSTIPGLKAQVFATTNPGNIGHLWVKDRWVIPARNKTYYDPISKRSRIFIPAKVEDNPTLVKNDPDYVAFLDSLPEKLRRAWRYGDWDVFEGQFFGEFNYDIHTCEPFEIPSQWRKVTATDYGTTNPFCNLWGAVDYEGDVWIYREAYQKGLNATEQALRILEMEYENEDIKTRLGDPSMWAKTQTVNFGRTYTLKAVSDFYQEAGLHLTPANNDIMNGCNAIREYLNIENGNPKLHIFTTCNNLIRTLPAMVHDEKKPEIYDSKGEDHAVDALRYMIMHVRQPYKPAEKPKEKFAFPVLPEQRKRAKVKDHRNFWE